MARITTGPLISDIRGKTGDQIFSRNRYGAYVKAFAVPTGTPSPAMENAKANMAAIVAAWHGLTEANRQRWITQALAMNARSKRVPRERLTGYNLFTRCQMWRLTAGLSQSTTPTALLRIPRFTASITYEDPSGNEAEVTWYNASSSWVINVYGSAQFDQSRYSPNVSPYKFIGSMAWPGNNSPENVYITLDYFTVWDIEEFTPDMCLFYKMRLVNLTNGQQSPELILRALTS